MSYFLYDRGLHHERANFGIKNKKTEAFTTLILLRGNHFSAEPAVRSSKQFDAFFNSNMKLVMLSLTTVFTIKFPPQFVGFLR